MFEVVILGGAVGRSIAEARHSLLSSSGSIVKHRAVLGLARSVALDLPNDRFRPCSYCAWAIANLSLPRVITCGALLMYKNSFPCGAAVLGEVYLI